MLDIYSRKITGWEVLLAESAHNSRSVVERAVLAKRHAINQAAREANPARWSGKARNWAPIRTVSLNPERELNITTSEPENQAA